MQNMPSHRRLPRVRTRVSAGRYAWSLGWTNQQTTGSRTKKKKNQTHKTDTRPNVGRLSQGHAAHLKRKKPKKFPRRAGFRFFENFVVDKYQFTECEYYKSHKIAYYLIGLFFVRTLLGRTVGGVGLL